MQDGNNVGDLNNDGVMDDEEGFLLEDAMELSGDVRLERLKKESVENIERMIKKNANNPSKMMINYQIARKRLLKDWFNREIGDRN